MTRILLAAALLGATFATTAVATGPHGGPCHVYWQSTAVPGVSKPFVFCDY